MRFPFRLTAGLLFRRTTRALPEKRDGSLILHLAPGPNFSMEDALAAARESEARVVWIAGIEPLEHPAAASIANALTASGRYVFLETDGLLLRRRIHEFQPSPRLYLTIRFDTSETFHAGCYASPLVLEGIRAAQLSGFMLCAHLILHASRAGELAQLHSKLSGLNVDGFLISPAEATGELQRRVVEARRNLLGRRWAYLSKVLDSLRVAAPSPEPAVDHRQPLMPPPSASCEESVPFQ
jgi:hypothetical protein